MYSETMCSDLDLFWQYVMYMFSFRSWKHEPQTFLKVHELSSERRRCEANLFEKERSQSVGVFQTLLQLPEEETKDAEAEIHFWFFEVKLVSAGVSGPTLYARRRSDGCCRRLFCLSPSCRQGLPPPPSCSCSPVMKTETKPSLQ